MGWYLNGNLNKCFRTLGLFEFHLKSSRHLWLPLTVTSLTPNWVPQIGHYFISLNISRLCTQIHKSSGKWPRNGNFTNQDWKYREAAVLAYGSIMEGPTSEKMLDFVVGSDILVGLLCLLACFLLMERKSGSHVNMEPQYPECP